MNKVFISWSGSFGKLIASYLRERLLKFSNLELWYSEKDIAIGGVWFEETRAALDEADFSIVCLTPGSSKKPWVNFESGFLFGKLGNSKLITFGETLEFPLKQLQRIDGTRKETWVSLLEEMTGRATPECQAWVDSCFGDLQTILNLAQSSPYAYMLEMDMLLGRLQDSVKRLQLNNSVQENVCLQQVVLASYVDLSDKLEGSSYRVPASEYPYYLVALQKKLNPVVTAIALVDKEEQFWQQPAGSEILQTVNKQSVRIFVFYSERHFMQMSEMLRHHAMKYRVYAMSYQTLTQSSSPEYIQDFSIIQTSDASILAYYTNLNGRRMIDFTSDSRKIQNYEKEMGAALLK
jgi:TIR domain